VVYVAGTIASGPFLFSAINFSLCPYSATRERQQAILGGGLAILRSVISQEEVSLRPRPAGGRPEDTGWSRVPLLVTS